MNSKYFDAEGRAKKAYFIDRDNWTMYTWGRSSPVYHMPVTHPQMIIEGYANGYTDKTEWCVYPDGVYLRLKYERQFDDFWTAIDASWHIYDHICRDKDDGLL